MQMADKWRIIRSAGSLEQQYQRLVQTLSRPWFYSQETTFNPKCAPLRYVNLKQTPSKMLHLHYIWH